MHKRNITIAALVLAGLVVAAFHFFTRLNHSQALGLFYFPSIFLTVILSGGVHSPSAIAAWSAFVGYSIFYWALFIVLYAFLWEIHLLNKAVHHLDDAMTHLSGAELDSRGALEKIGRAIAEVETHRRRNWFLEDAPGLDLSKPPYELALQAIRDAADEKVVKGVMKRLNSRLAARIGREKARGVLAQLVAEKRGGSGS
jgi:hypothetical protein